MLTMVSSGRIVIHFRIQVLGAVVRLGGEGR